MIHKLTFNPHLEKLPVYQPGRPIEEVAREVGLPADSIIKLASNENPLGPSPKALAAMQRALEQLHLYPDGNAFYLKQKLAQKRGLSTANLILGNGSNEILELIGHTLISPHAEVVMSEFCFAVYPIVTHLFGGTPITVQAKSLGHDLPSMLNAINASTKVVFVANPNNPTGTLNSNSEIIDFIRAIPPHVLIAMDEAYIEFLDDPPDLIPMITSGEIPNLILMRTFSKIYGLAGLRLGYGIGSPELIQAMEKARQPFNVNALVQAAALAALDDDDHLHATLANNREGLKYFEEVLKKLNVEFIPSSANFILVKTGNGMEMFQKLQQQGIITRPMASYGLPEWLRISVGTPSQNQRCMEALSRDYVVR